MNQAFFGILLSTIGVMLYVTYQAAPEAFDAVSTLNTCQRMADQCAAGAEPQRSAFCTKASSLLTAVKVEHRHEPARFCQQALQTMDMANQVGWTKADEAFEVALQQQKVQDLKEVAQP